MSLIFLDGCGEYYSSADLPRVWSAVEFGSGSPLIVQPTGGRLGNANILFGNTNQRLTSGFAPVQTIVIGWAFKMATLPVGNVTLCNFWGPGGVIHGFLRITSTASLEWVNVSAVRANTAGAVVLANTFHYVEVKVTISQTVGVVVIKVDNNEEANETGIDTFNFGEGELCNAIAFLGTNHQIDDLYILNTAGSAPYNDFLSDVRIEALLPDADGATSQFDTTFPASPTNHFSKVDEATPDDDTSYNETATVNDIDLFDYEALPTMIGGATVLGVKSAVLANKQDAGDAPFRLITRPISTNRNGAITHQPSIDYHYDFEIWEDNPETSSPWLESEIDAAEFGVEAL